MDTFSWPQPKPLNPQHVRIAIVSIVVAALIAVGIVLAVSLHHSSAPQTLSYKDGYVSGYQDLGNGSGLGFATNDGLPTSDCQDAWITAELASGDNQSQWISGCVAGLNAANYNANHPGANG